MPNIRLTQVAVDRVAPPKSGRITYWDRTVPSFGLRVTAAGARSWVVVYRHGGRKVWFTLGTVAKVPSVETARKAAREAMAAVAAGGNPAAEKRATAARSAANTVETAVAMYLRDCERRLKPKSLAGYRQLFEHDVLPAWGERELTSIAKADVLALITDKAARRERRRKGLNHGANVQAGKLLIRLRTFFGWCAAHDFVTADPTTGVRRPAKEAQRDRVLSDSELVEFWNTAEAMGYPFGPLLQLMLTTAQRESEVSGMRWSELDIDKALWEIPSDRAKNKKAHIVHLSTLSLEVLARVPRQPDQDLLFSTNGRNPVSGFSKAKARLDRAMTDSTDWVLHDVRRTATTGMARLNVRAEVCDKILNHTSGTIRGVAAIYNRYQFLDERRVALETWSRFLESLIRPVASNVVAIR